MKQILVNDASVLLNLIATDRIVEIAAALDLQLAICTRVRDEVKTLRDPVSGEMVPIDISQLTSDDTLVVLDFASPAEQDLFVREASAVDDGEAMSIAIAASRGYPLAIDDKKARHHVRKEYPDIRVWSTAEIMQKWAERGSASPAGIAAAIRNIELRARYFPVQTAPSFAWWTAARQNT